jgi:hypothetical protein
MPLSHTNMDLIRQLLRSYWVKEMVPREPAHAAARPGDH